MATTLIVLFLNWSLLSIFAKKDKQDTQDTAGKARMNSLTTFSYGFLHMDVPMLAGQQRVTSSQCGHRM